MSEAVNTTSRDNNGDSGLNGKLNVPVLFLDWNVLSVCALSVGRVGGHGLYVYKRIFVLIKGCFWPFNLFSAVKLH